MMEFFKDIISTVFSNVAWVALVISAISVLITCEIARQNAFLSQLKIINEILAAFCQQARYMTHNFQAVFGEERNRAPAMKELKEHHLAVHFAVAAYPREDFVNRLTKAVDQYYDLCEELRDKGQGQRSPAIRAEEMEEALKTLMAGEFSKIYFFRSSHRRAKLNRCAKSLFTRLWRWSKQRFNRGRRSIGKICGKLRDRIHPNNR